MPFLPRTALSLSAALAVAAALPCGASAAEIYAAPVGTGGDCLNAAAPCTIAAALDVARTSPGGDVVNLAAGQYADPVIATDPALDGLTLRGAGKRRTILAAPVFDRAVVELGWGGGSMAVESLAVDSPNSGMFAPGIGSRLARLSVRDVRVIHTFGPNGKSASAIDAPGAGSELVLDGVDVSADTESYDAAIGAVTAGGPLTIRDSAVRDITLGATSTIVARGDVSILRSTITRSELNLGSVVHLASPATARSVTIDSSLIRGGNTSIQLDVGNAATQAQLRGLTLAPSWDSNGWGVAIVGDGASSAHANVENSLLLTRGVRAGGGASASCSFTNIAPTALNSGADCSTAAGNPGGNTALRDDEIRLDSDYALRADSPVIDSGNPAGPTPGSRRPTASAARAPRLATTPATPARPPRQGRLRALPPKPTVTIVSADRFPSGAPAQFSAITNAIDPAFVWTFGDEITGAGERRRATPSRRPGAPR